MDFLSVSDLLSLWKTCRCYRDSYTKILHTRRLREVGYELIHQLPDEPYLLTSFKLLKLQYNLLLDNKYYFGSNVQCDNAQGEAFFVVRGNVHLSTHNYRINIWRGTVFQIEGYLTSNGIRINAHTRGHVTGIKADYQYPYVFNIQIYGTLPSRDLVNEAEVIVIRLIDEAKIKIDHVIVVSAKHKINELRRERSVSKTK